jgi:hypothetical protein
MIQLQSRDRSRIFLIERPNKKLRNIKELILQKRIRTRTYIVQNLIQDKNKAWIHFGCPNCNKAIVGKETISNNVFQLMNNIKN